MTRILITDKRLADKRFRRTEDAILQAFFKDDYVSVKMMAKRAGVARSTIYTHHRTVRDIIPDYENYILKKFKQYINSYFKIKRNRIKTIFVHALIFMILNKRIVMIVLSSDGGEILKRMIDLIKDAIMREMGISKKNNKVFMVYKSEVSTIIKDWCDGGFLEDGIEKTVNNIVYLTKTAKQRLAPLK